VLTILRRRRFVIAPHALRHLAGCAHKVDPVRGRLPTVGSRRLRGMDRAGAR
jgi:hypothetical protein